MEGDGKGNQEQEKDEEELYECLQDVSKHDDINSESRQLANKQNKLHPCEEDSQNSHLPLPGLQQEWSLLQSARGNGVGGVTGWEG